MNTLKAIRYISLYMGVVFLSSGAVAQEVIKVSVPTFSTEQRSPYSAQGKRDPFRPFLKMVDEPNKQPGSDLPPIKRYPLPEFRITGIIKKSKQQPRAVIVDPEKNTYVLGVGDEIGNKEGKVVEVRENGILVQERKVMKDIYGDEKFETEKTVLAFGDE